MNLFIKVLIITFFSGVFVSQTTFAGTVAAFEQQLNEHKGKVVYLDFWASWCVPCRRSFPWMNKLQQQYQKNGLVVFSVNLDTDKSFATKFLSETPANFAVFYDPKGKVAKAFNLRGMPSSYIIDRSGKVVSTHVGFSDKKQADYQRAIENQLNK